MCEIRNELGSLISGFVQLYSPSTDNTYDFINGVCEDNVELTDDLYVFSYNPIYATTDTYIDNQYSYLAPANKTFFTIDFNKSTNDKIILLSANVTVKSESAISKKLISNSYITRSGIISPNDSNYDLSIATVNIKGGDYYEIVIPFSRINSGTARKHCNCLITKNNEKIDVAYYFLFEINDKQYINYNIDLTEYSENDIFTIQYTVNALSKEQSIELHNDTGYIFYLYNATEWQNRAGFINKLRQRHITTKGGIL